MSRPKWKTWQYWTRLGLFAVVVMVIVIIIGQIVFMHLETDAMIQPVSSSVSLPDDFDAQAITFTGSDDLTLSGWSVDSQNGVTVILLHGYDNNRTQLLWHARQLVDAGFGVLMYDLRGHGESEGDQRSNGWRDVDDVVGALDFLENTGDVIGVYGFSVGGQIALRAAAKMPEIEAIFADGPSGGTAADYPSPVNFQEQFIFRLAPIADWMLSSRTDTPIPEPMRDVLPAIAPRPIFFVATGQHPLIPGGEARLVRPFYEMTQDHAEWWEIPETVHGGGWKVRPEEYADNLIAFFSQLVQDEGSTAN